MKIEESDWELEPLSSPVSSHLHSPAIHLGFQDTYEESTDLVASSPHSDRFSGRTACSPIPLPAASDDPRTQPLAHYHHTDVRAKGGDDSATRNEAEFNTSNLQNYNFENSGSGMLPVLPAINPLQFDFFPEPDLGDDPEQRTVTAELQAELLSKHQQQVRSKLIDQQQEKPQASDSESEGRFSEENHVGEDEEDFEPSGTFAVPMQKAKTDVLESPKPKVSELHPPVQLVQRDDNKVGDASVFNAVDWAVRPPVHQVYECLDKSFPYHNLDEPIDLGPCVTPTNISRDLPRLPEITSNPEPDTFLSLPSQGKRPPALLSRVRSIRVVAEEQQIQLGRPESEECNTSAGLTIQSMKYKHDGVTNGEGDKDDLGRVKPTNSLKMIGLQRHKSTKLWGVRTEEVPPPGNDTYTVSPNNDPDSCQWHFDSVLSPFQNLRISCDTLLRLHSVTCSRFPYPHIFLTGSLVSFKWAKGRLLGRGSFGEVYL